MGLNILSINNRAIIPYEVIPLLAGVYVGYNNAQGVNVDTTEQVLTYIPIAFATTITPIAMLTASRKKYVPSLEEILSNEQVLKETGKNTLKSGIATAVGYGIGYLIGSMNK